jgi:hypothetical protein
VLSVARLCSPSATSNWVDPRGRRRRIVTGRPYLMPCALRPELRMGKLLGLTTFPSTSGAGQAENNGKVRSRPISRSLGGGACVSQDRSKTFAEFPPRQRPASFSIDQGAREGARTRATHARSSKSRLTATRRPNPECVRLDHTAIMRSSQRPSSAEVPRARCCCVRCRGASATLPICRRTTWSLAWRGSARVRRAAARIGRTAGSAVASHAGSLTSVSPVIRRAQRARTR